MLGEVLRGKPEDRKYREVKKYVHHLPVRVTGAEREIILLEAKERGLSVSRYMAVVSTGAKLSVRKEEREILAHLSYLFEKVSHNLNQVAKQGNAGLKGTMKFPRSEEVYRVIRAVEEASRVVVSKMSY
jgi:hypothetical protein